MMAAMRLPPLALRGQLTRNEPMSRHTSWRVGGPADLWYQPADLDDLANFIAGLPAEEPLTWVGLGSNLLVRDGGIRGTVIATAGRLDGMERFDATGLRVGAGVYCAKVARFAAGADLVGAEFLAGIPGTLGGALAMNAGAFGGETWPIVEAVRTIDRRGVIRRRTPEDYQIGYRSVQGPGGEWFVSADLRLSEGDGGAARERIRELLNRRGQTQPTQQPSCGSVFRNPPGDHAARLIEAAGLKGYRIGQAQVSEKHANFIINLGAAQAAVLEALVEHVRTVVRDKHGVSLVHEVRMIGEAAL